jgi:hypothetical protein
LARQVELLVNRQLQEVGVDANRFAWRKLTANPVSQRRCLRLAQVWGAQGVSNKVPVFQYISVDQTKRVAAKPRKLFCEKAANGPSTNDQDRAREPAMPCIDNSLVSHLRQS